MIPNDKFVSRYIELRKRECRLYDDADVLKLPDLDANHPHISQYMLRTR